LTAVLALSAATAMPLGVLTAHAIPATYAIDSDHSNVSFRIRHFFSKVPGQFENVEGTIIYDPDNPSASNVSATIDAASIHTRNTKRDNHLKSEDFFDVEKYPTITFVSKKVDWSGPTKAAAKSGKRPAATNVFPKKFAVNGDLTIHGVTKPVTLECEFLGTQNAGVMGERASFSAHTTINRTDYGILWNKNLDKGGTLLGDDVDIQLDVEAVKATLGGGPAREGATNK
jgi:polyisoprenoid-binding protein YceI